MGTEGRRRLCCGRSGFAVYYCLACYCRYFYRALPALFSFSAPASGVAPTVETFWLPVTQVNLRRLVEYGKQDPYDATLLNSNSRLAVFALKTRLF